jgi:cellulose biosynthesis protein BcsQ
MRVISVVASKGGVGKTTVSNVIAGILAEGNLSVELWDTDCNQYSAETMAFSELLPYQVKTVANERDFDEALNQCQVDNVVIDTAPHAHDTELFIHILKQSDVIIGVTRPLPNDVLAFEKIMLPLLGQIKAPQKALVINQRSHIQSSIQQAAEELVQERISGGIQVLETRLHTRAAYASIGYFETDAKTDKKKIDETTALKRELVEKEIL